MKQVHDEFYVDVATFKGLVEAIDRQTSTYSVDTKSTGAVSTERSVTVGGVKFIEQKEY